MLDQLTEGEVLGDEFDVEEELEATQIGGLIDSTPPVKEVKEEIVDEGANLDDEAA